MKQGILFKTRTYLIGPMEFAQDGETWRNHVKTSLKHRGIRCFDPFDKPCENAVEEGESKTKEWKSLMLKGKFNKAQAWAKRIRNEDLRYCDLVDFAIAYIDPKIPTFGSIEELSWICRCKKPIFLVIDGGKKKTPLWIMGMFPHKYIYNTVEEALDMIKKIDDGLIKLDSTRWRLLKFEYR